MKQHLTSRQITEYVAGAAGPGIIGHVSECPACRAETERLADSLALYRQSVTDWSLGMKAVPLRVPDRRLPLRQLVWATALAACLIAGLVLPHAKEPAPRTISDADLLVQVDRQLAENVPPSLEPIEVQK